MKRRTLLWVAIVLAIAVAFSYLRFSGGETPAGQRPLATIDAGAVQALRTDFNAAVGKTRMIVLLSPT